MACNFSRLVVRWVFVLRLLRSGFRLGFCGLQRLPELVVIEFRLVGSGFTRLGLRLWERSVTASVAGLSGVDPVQGLCGLGRPVSG
jgi:hypothetical protein